MRRNNTAHLAGVVALAVAMSAGCSGDKGDKGVKGDKADKQTARASTPAQPKTTAKTNPTKAATPRPGGLGCNMIDRMPKDGEVTAIEHLAGKDNLGMQVVGGKVALRAGTTMTGSTWRFEMRGSHAEVQDQGQKACVAIARLTFSLPRAKPEVNKAIPYKLVGKIADIPGGLIPAIFVDINEKKALAGGGNQTIEYAGTEGTYTFTRLNHKGGRNNQHTLAFSVVFQKITAGKLDPAVKTKLTGSFTIQTRRPL